mmetsp:Transcript_7177/g.16879  ORF Transcript_7177/g.16879 Transcript_7177/m.16879 type:complete len:151 (+) Transcript_7177:281-733(+)
MFYNNKAAKKNAAEAKNTDRLAALLTTGAVGAGWGTETGAATGGATGASVAATGATGASVGMGAMVGVSVETTGAIEMVGLTVGASEGPSEGMSLGISVVGISATWYAEMTPRVSATSKMSERGVSVISPLTEKLMDSVHRSSRVSKSAA